MVKVLMFSRSIDNVLKFSLKVENAPTRIMTI